LEGEFSLRTTRGAIGEEKGVKGRGKKLGGLKEKRKLDLQVVKQDFMKSHRKKKTIRERRKKEGTFKEIDIQKGQRLLKVTNSKGHCGGIIVGKRQGNYAQTENTQKRGEKREFHLTENCWPMEKRKKRAGGGTASAGRRVCD